MLVLLSLLLLLTMAAIHDGFVIMEADVPRAVQKFTVTSQAESTTVIELIFHVREKNGEQLEKLLLSTSDPTSASYGQHLSKAEVDKLTSNPEALKVVSDYLQSLEGVSVNPSSHHYHISALASVATWNAALNSNFHNYERVDGPGKIVNVIRTAEYSLPESVAPFVVSVSNTIHFPIELTHRLPSIRSGAHVIGMVDKI